MHRQGQHVVCEARQAASYRIKLRCPFTLSSATAARRGTYLPRATRDHATRDLATTSRRLSVRFHGILSLLCHLTAGSRAAHAAVPGGWGHTQAWAWLCDRFVNYLLLQVVDVDQNLEAMFVKIDTDLIAPNRLGLAQALDGIGQRSSHSISQTLNTAMAHVMGTESALVTLNVLSGTLRCL
jgi:hypothetical protein